MARVAIVCSWERWKREVVERDAVLTSPTGRIAVTPNDDVLIHIDSPKRARMFTFDELESFIEWGDQEMNETANVARSRLIGSPRVPAPYNQ